MPFSRPTIARLKSRVYADIESTLRSGAVYIRRTFERAVGLAVSGVAHTLHGHVQWASRQILPTTADEEFLLEHAEIWMGPDARNQATRSEFTATATGTAADVDIPDDTRYTRADGFEYRTIGDVAIPSSPPYEIEVTLRAVLAGSAGNVVPGSTLTITSPIADLDSVVTVNGSGSYSIGDGADIEQVEALRNRLVEYIQNPPKGGATGDYVTWAKEVDGVTRAWELPQQLGPGTVMLLFVLDIFDDDGNFVETLFPGAPEIEEVQDYLNGLIPISANGSLTADSGHIDYVFAPTPAPLDPIIELDPNTPAVRLAVTRSLQDLLLREARPSNVESLRTIPLSRIREAISIAVGEENHNLVSPIADVVPSATELVVLGTPDFQDMP